MKTTISFCGALILATQCRGDLFVFAQSAQIRTGMGPQALQCGDYNRDGNMDFIVGWADSASARVFIGGGNGTFQVNASYSAAGRLFAQNDFNNDGIVDFAFPGDGATSIMRGNGDGTFTNTYILYTGSAGFLARSADLDRNGKPDLLIGRGSSSTITMLEGLGNGDFGGGNGVRVGGVPTWISTADLDNDGFPDIVASIRSSYLITVLFNTRSLTFGRSTNLTVGLFPYYVVIDDVNRDGKQDILTADSGDETVSVLLGNGDGSFAAVRTSVVGPNPKVLALDDFNGDGIIDLAVATSGTNSFAIASGDGDGGFVVSTNITVIGNPITIAATDFNGDGKPDIAVTTNWDYLYVFLNETTGSVPAKLRLSRSAQHSVIRWPVFGNGRFKLETCSDLSTAWSGVTNLPMINGIEYIVTNGITSPTQFYRLRKP
jgi:hypothetical protein